jgi:dethiobiotin synthetase
MKQRAWSREGNAKGFFITGTDTGVGKTVITAALIKAVGLLGLKACSMKPIETGCKTAVSSQQSAVSSKKRTLIPSDGMFLKKMAGIDDSIDLITPIRFENPLAPITASEIEGREIDLDKIHIAYSELSRKYDVIIVEGIGGLLVPIKRDYFVLDLARDFGLPIIVVSRPGLGTLNHTLLTVNYAIKEGLDVAGIIINYSQPPEGTLAENTNPEVIKQISPVPLIGIFPYLEDLSSNTIEKAGVKNLDLEILKKYF